MGAESGTKNLALETLEGEPPAPQPPEDRVEARLRAVLEESPYLFDFFQAVRLIERLDRRRVPIGRFSKPGEEAVRAGAHVSPVFPASQIQNLSRTEEDKPPFLRVNFMGLVGPLGVLPLVYTELAAERVRVRDYTLRDFLDLFHHRIISLFYQAWEKYRFEVAYERQERDRVGQHVRDFIGLGTAGLANRQKVADDSLVFYGGLLSQFPRSAAALEQLLEDHFGVPVEVEQFAGAWYPLDEATQCCFREGDSYSEQLGWGAVVGDEVWNQQSVVRVKIGPLTLEQYNDFLPEGTAYEPLRDITRFFAGLEMDFEAQLILKRDEVPAPELGAEGAPAPRLGWVSWAKSRDMDRDPGETILRL